MRSVLSFTLLIGSVLIFGSLAQARTCETVFSEQNSKLAADLLHTRVQGAQRFLQLMRGGLASRYRLKAEVAELAHHLAGLDGSLGQTHALKWPDAIGSIRKQVRGTTLSYTIPSLIIAKDGTSLPLGARPKGLNSVFSRVLVGMMEAVRIDLQNNPHIDQVEMVAGSVVNMDLVALLKQSGFTKMGGDPVASGFPGRRPPPDMYVHQTAGGPFMRDMGFGMGMDSMFSALAQTHPDRGRSWALQFQVTR